MTQNFSLSVCVERPEKVLGEAMNEMRSWLDTNKIRPAGFKSDAKAPGPVEFDTRLARDDEARLFERAFI